MSLSSKSSLNPSNNYKNAFRLYKLYIFVIFFTLISCFERKKLEANLKLELHFFFAQSIIGTILNRNFFLQSLESKLLLGSTQWVRVHIRSYFVRVQQRKNVS